MKNSARKTVKIQTDIFVDLSVYIVATVHIRCDHVVLHLTWCYSTNPSYHSDQFDMIRFCSIQFPVKDRHQWWRRDLQCSLL